MQTWTRHSNGMVTDGQGVWVREDPDAAPFREILAAVAAGTAEVVDYAPPPPTYRELRALAYRDELGKESGDFIKTLGDVLDVVLAQVEADRVHAGANRTPEFNGLVTKVMQIKSRYPKPPD
jgi:hypothetical protein